MLDTDGMTAEELRVAAQELLDMAEEIENGPRVRPYSMYTHQSKDSNAEIWGEFQQPRGTDAFGAFLRAGYEVEINCEVDLDTGEAYAVGVNGVALGTKVKI